MNKNIPWDSEKEDQFLKDFYPDFGLEYCAKKLQRRTKGAIQYRVSKLGLFRTRKLRVKSYNTGKKTLQCVCCGNAMLKAKERGFCKECAEIAGKDMILTLNERKHIRQARLAATLGNTKKTAIADIALLKHRLPRLNDSAQKQAQRTIENLMQQIEAA